MSLMNDINIFFSDIRPSALRPSGDRARSGRRVAWADGGEGVASVRHPDAYTVRPPPDVINRHQAVEIERRLLHEAWERVSSGNDDEVAFFVHRDTGEVKFHRPSIEDERKDVARRRGTQQIAAAVACGTSADRDRAKWLVEEHGFGSIQAACLLASGADDAFRLETARRHELRQEASRWRGQF